MEFLEILVIILSCSVIGVSVLLFSRMKGTKRKVNKAVSDSVDSAVEVMQGALNAHKAELKRVNGQNAMLKKKLDQIQYGEEEEKESISTPQIKELLKTQGINPALLDLPGVGEYIQEQIKGKSLVELASLVQTYKQFIPQNLKSGGDTQESEYSDVKSWA